MTSPMIRYYEKLTTNYMILAIVAAPFTVFHAYLGLWTWFWVGLGITAGSIFIAIRSAMEIDDLTKIAKAIEEGKKKRVKALYGKEEDL